METIGIILLVAFLGGLIAFKLKNNLSKYFEVVNKGKPNAFLRVKLPIKCDYDIETFAKGNGGGVSADPKHGNNENQTT